MAKLPLTIKSTYLPEWGAYEGARELIQNGKDAETEFSAPLTVHHIPGNYDNVAGEATPDRLIIENDGCTLSREALLLGQTSKEGRGDMIGHFGEGLKLGILALVRAGHSVKVRTGAEVWTASLERSDRFEADVLTFDIQGGREQKNRVRVEISGITAEDWVKFKTCFLFLAERKNDDAVETASGTLLLAPRMKGRLYVKGIFVQHATDLAYGYDLKDIKTDRDRRLVSSYDLEPATRRIWQEALAQRPDLFEGFGAMLAHGKQDVRGIADWNVAHLPAGVVDAVVAAFQERHGGDAIPVAGMAESKLVGHVGKKGVVVPEQLAAVLRSVLPSPQAVVEQLKTEVKRTFSWAYLSKAEQENYDRAVALVGKVRPTHCDGNVEVATFGSEDLMGLHKDGKIFLARVVLSDFPQALRTLIHETAHASTGAADGDKSHVQEIEEIWSEVFAIQLASA